MSCKKCRCNTWVRNIADKDESLYRRAIQIYSDNDYYISNSSRGDITNYSLHNIHGNGESKDFLDALRYARNRCCYQHCHYHQDTKHGELNKIMKDVKSIVKRIDKLFKK